LDRASYMHDVVFNFGVINSARLPPLLMTFNDVWRQSLLAYMTNYHRRTLIIIYGLQYTVNLTLVLRLGVKSSQLSFWISKKFLFSVERCPFVTFPEYEMGTKCNNHVANRCIRSCLAWRQTRVNFFEIGEILWSCWLIRENRSRISIVVIQVTKSNFPLSES